MAELNKYNKRKQAKLTESTVKKLEEAFSIGADITAACAYADISRQSYYSWVEEMPELQEKFDKLREKPVLKAYNTIMKDLDKPESAKWYLERKRKKEFSTRKELTGEDGGPIGLSVEKKADITKALSDL